MTFKTIDLTFGAVFVCLMAIGANIAVWFPFLVLPIGGASVPLSLQTFFAVICGMMLGKKRALMALLAYVTVGLAGVPVFANMQAGPVQLLKPTGGFILSFIVVAFLVGWIVETSSPPSFKRLLFAALMGLVLNYAIGVNYMYIAMNSWLDLGVEYGLAWSSMIPFFIKDGVLALLSAVFMQQLYARLPRHWLQTDLRHSA